MAISAAISMILTSVGGPGYYFSMMRGPDLETAEANVGRSLKSAHSPDTPGIVHLTIAYLWSLI
jgi:hypothetical protein